MRNSSEHFIPEQHKIHGFFAHVIELVEEALHCLAHFVRLCDFQVGAGVALHIHKVAKHESVQFVIVDLAVHVAVEITEEVVKVDFKLGGENFLDVTSEPVAILVVDQTVVVNTENLHKSEVNTRNTI